ncbi:MAG: ABC transporter ATP-binding protein [Rhizobiales bacterium]|nr:ABC transporter ATP-binding protein [Hyphomicrobiales bacterium]
MGQITIEHVVKRFGSHAVINDVSLRVDDGEFVVFVGPSGCGKSTLLRLITGLEDLTSGSILIDGRDVSGVRPSERKLAMVFQSYALFPHISVRDNIAFGLKIAGEPRDVIDRKVGDAARILALTDYLDRKPRQLSGGQRQRVAIGRAIVRQPTAFLFDEPLSNLDAALRVQMRVELIKLRDTLKTTMIYVTHDQVEAMTMADKIVVLNAGRIEQFATPLELYDAPANLFVAGFIGSPKMNLIDIAASDDVDLTFADGSRLAHGGIKGAGKAPDKLGIRPEHLAYSAQGGLWRGEIAVEEQLGSDAFFYVTVPQIGTLTVRAVGERSFRSGDAIYLTPPPDKCHVFDTAGQRMTRPGDAANQTAGTR